MEKKVNDFLQYSNSPKRGTPVSRHVLRNTMRRMAHKDYQNEIYVSIIDLKMQHLTGNSQYKWFDEFIDFNAQLEHPLFRQFIKSKLEQYPLFERARNVRSVLETMSYVEVGEYCYQMDFEALEYFRSHIDEHVRKQQVVKYSAQELLDQYNKVKALEGKIVVDDLQQIDEYVEHGGNIENYEIARDSEIEPSDCDEIVEKYQLSAEGVLYDDSRIENVDRRATLDEVKTNAVYELSKRYTGINFPVMIYAPPFSGKTQLNLQKRCYTDTDAMLSWQLQGSGGLFITNMPHLLKHSRLSIAIIPSKREFMRRCRMRGLEPEDQWYIDLVNESNNASGKILSDKYLLELSCIGGSSQSKDSAKP